LEQYALCHPEISFKLFHNKKVIFDYKSTTEKLTRFTQIYGSEIANKLITLEYQGTDIQVQGFIGKPETAREKAYIQHFFVNGRPLEAIYFSHAIKSGFGSLIF